jgi:tetratricopeptide (TPR) repeat protein
MRLVRTTIYFTILILSGFSLSARAANDVLLPLPFENGASRTEYQWISDSFTVMMAGLLDTPGLVVLSPEEVAAAYEKAGLRSGAPMTRASEIKLAETLQANLVLVGAYEILEDKGTKTISITAKLIDIREGRVKPYTFSGLLSDLQAMQGILAWNILYERDPALPYSQDQLRRRARMVPPKAYEFYVKSMQAPDLKSREIFVKRAIKEYNEAEPVGHYAQALFQLGLVKYKNKEYAEAERNFRELIKDDPYYLEGLFYQGLATNYQNHFSESLDAFEKLAAGLPLVEVLNNAGVVALAKADLPRAMMHLQRASLSAQNDDTIRFNYGYALWKNKNYEAAATEFKAAAMVNPKDGEAQYLLAKSLKAAGREPESAGADQEARKYLGNYAKWEVLPEAEKLTKIPNLTRLKTDFNRTTFYKLIRKQSYSPGTPSVQSRRAVQSLEQARQFLTEKRDAEALTELQNAINGDPTLAEAHYLRGQIFQRRNETDTALSAFSAAIYWNPRLVGAHVALGQLYLARNDRARALSHSKLATEIDPSDREALNLKRQVETSR